MVGTPSKTVTRWPAMIRSACSASNRGSRVRQAPDATATLSATVCPNTWNSGSPPKMTSPGPAHTMSLRATRMAGRAGGVEDHRGVFVIPIGDLVVGGGGREQLREADRVHHDDFGL